jgi:phosphoglycolate phosphatase
VTVTETAIERLKSLQAILFDKDGTLIDFHGTWGPALKGVIEAMTDDPTRRDALFTLNALDPRTLAFDPRSPFIAGTSADYGPDWAAILGVPCDAAFIAELDRLCEVETARTLAPIGDPLGVFARLAGRGLILGILTNDTENAARVQTTRLGLHRHLSTVIGYDSGYGYKPAPGPVLAFADIHAVPPARIAVVGDSRHDLACARAAGALAVAVLSGVADHDELAPHADLVVDDITALEALFG